MNSINWVPLLPLIVQLAGTVSIMLVIAFYRRHTLVAGLTLAVLLLSFIFIVVNASAAAIQVTTLLIFDGFANLINGLIVFASMIVLLLGYGYLRNRPEKREEFYLLLLTAVMGSIVIASSSHFISFFLGLEILSIALYAMIAYAFQNQLSIEAGVKYLVLAASSAAFLLFGMGMIYYELGTMEFRQIAAKLTATSSMSVVMLAGLALILVGIGYKLALVPFHFWTPDVYEGAPAPVSAFVASVSKGSMFAVLVRFFTQVNPNGHPSLYLAVAVVAIATMLAGNFLALRQRNLKRLLAYSSIANLGYLLVAFLSTGNQALQASTFFLVSYFVTVIAAFGVVTVLSGRDRDADQLEQYRGLFWRKPWLAAILTVAMFSLAGLPLTVGFIGKFYVVLAGVASALWLLVLVLVVSSAIGLYYYLRVIVVMYTHPVEAQPSYTLTPSLSIAGSLSLAMLLLLIIWLGIYPTPLVDIIRALTSRV
jgi:NADH-quinone oxidoreductase subunit N